KKSFILAILLTFVLVIVFFLQNNNYSDKKEYLKLFPALNEKIDNIYKIEVVNSENSIHLLKKNNEWYLPSYNNYPVAQNKINSFLLNIVSLKTVDKKTNNPENHKKLGLSLPLAEGSNRFRIFDNNKELLADFIIGKKSNQNEDFSYIRNIDSSITWLFKSDIKFFNTELDWAEESILRIARWRVKSIKIQSIEKKDKNIFISKNKYSDQMYTLKGIPDKYELASTYSISSYTSLLESLKKTDIKLFSDNFKLIKRIKYQTFDGIDVSIDLYNINEDIYSHFSIISDSLIREELAEDEPVIVGLPKMKSYDDIKKEVNKYSYISNWLYRLNGDVNKEFLKPFSALIKKKEINKTKP
ncbi:DUF4340 domain-containing protein, partial [Alphaproteobacteria bacterium]|nr:DUF4340 domain-containing protein [Alphaproteobacteria bacterium]